MIWWHKICSASWVPIPPAHHVRMELLGWNQKPFRSSTSYHHGCWFRPCLPYPMVFLIPDSVLLEWRRPFRGVIDNFKWGWNIKNLQIFWFCFFGSPKSAYEVHLTLQVRAREPPQSACSGGIPPGSFAMYLLLQLMPWNIINIVTIRARAIVFSTQ